MASAAQYLTDALPIETFVQDNWIAPLKNLEFVLLDYEGLTKSSGQVKGSQSIPSYGIPQPVDVSGLDLSQDLEEEEEEEDPFLEAQVCRALLLQILRRSIYDWVLYRTSTRILLKQRAENAFYWLFVENEESRTWAVRREHGKLLTAFLTICDVLDLDPSVVRRRARTLTKKDIIGVGRPAERRHPRTSVEDTTQFEDYCVFDVDVDSLPTYDPMFPSDDYSM